MSVTNFTSAIAAVRARLLATTNVPMVFDNGIINLTEKNQLHGRASISIGEGRLIQLGTRRWRYTGMLSIELRASMESGDAASSGACDIIMTAFRSQSADGVLYRVPTYLPAETRDGWYRSILECPFEFDVSE